MRPHKRLILTLSALAIVFVIGWSSNSVLGKVAQDEDDTPRAGVAFQMRELEAERAEAGRSYLPFLNRSTLSCGVYFLAAGAKDGQSPHGQDEVYYVQSGKAKLNVEGDDFDATPGAVLFVAANAKHNFHSIEEDLTLLVFFSTAAVDE